MINLEYESDFKPYLYKLPLELGTFHQLFKHLGTEASSPPSSTVEVLSRIFKNSEGKQLDPNGDAHCQEGGFWPIQESAERLCQGAGGLENIRDLALYLPSQDGDWSGRAS